MCVLAHYLENAGIPTVVISLVRPHSQAIRPPRALFVPFELGRPLGDPGDADGQTDVLRKALSLLDHNGPDPVLADYPDPQPKTSTWKPAQHSNDAGLQAELSSILRSYDQAKQKTGRTTFGVSGLTTDELVAMFEAEATSQTGTSSSVSSKLIRYAIDDLKMLYFEAACQGETGIPSKALTDWFWRQTLAGKAIVSLRAAYLASNDKGRNMIANSMVPGEWIEKLGL
ncbi:MAG: hypothetical protein ACI92A_001929 [Candidatus Paceibacteria bacterium]